MLTLTKTVLCPSCFKEIIIKGFATSEQAGTSVAVMSTNWPLDIACLCGCTFRVTP